MKTIKILSAAIVMLGMSIGMFGQQPTSVKLETGGDDYYRHGYNKAGGPFVDPGNPEGQEIRDSVTVSAKMKYFVLPDPSISPDYDPTTTSGIIDFTKVNSEFEWQFRRAGGAALGENITTPAKNRPIVEIEWKNTGVDSLVVKEIPNLGAACAGNYTVIPVAIIPKPTITFSPVGTAYKDSACHTQAELTTGGGVTYSFPAVATTKSSQVKIKYEVFKPDNTSLGSDIIDFKGTVSDDLVTGSFTNTLLKFTEYGTYRVVITEITDRVSRKSDVNNTGAGVLTPSGSIEFAYKVMPPVQTGPIYRIPNNY